jgi:hypothetical protein
VGDNCDELGRQRGAKAVSEAPAKLASEDDQPVDTTLGNNTNSRLRSGLKFVGKARQILADFNKIRPDFTVQEYREFAYALSTNIQFCQEIDEIIDGLRKGGVREQ